MKSTNRAVPPPPLNLDLGQKPHHLPMPEPTTPPHHPPRSRSPTSLSSGSHWSPGLPDSAVDTRARVWKWAREVLEWQLRKEDGDDDDDESSSSGGGGDADAPLSPPAMAPFSDTDTELSIWTCPDEPSTPIVGNNRGGDGALPLVNIPGDTDTELSICPDEPSTPIVGNNRGGDGALPLVNIPGDSDTELSICPDEPSTPVVGDHENSAPPGSLPDTDSELSVVWTCPSDEEHGSGGGSSSSSDKSGGVKRKWEGGDEEEEEVEEDGGRRKRRRSV